MSTVLARRVASTPVRAAAQTWAKIVEIIAPDPESPARKEMAKVAGTACASIRFRSPQGRADRDLGRRATGARLLRVR